jgi:2,4-dienoyl-CoA reductase (NADPH2)
VDIITGKKFDEVDIRDWVEKHGSSSVKPVVIMTTGVHPRRIRIEGADHPKVLSYADVLYRGKPVGKKVAIIGAGGIGVDTTEFLLEEDYDPVSFLEHWGIDEYYRERGGLLKQPVLTPTSREIYLLKRQEGKMGADLGKTTAWIHRAELKRRGVKLLTGVEYKKVDDNGLHIIHNGVEQVLEVDHVVVCAGQESENILSQFIQELDCNFHVCGGALDARGIDAKRAILEGTLIAIKI